MQRFAAFVVAAGLLSGPAGATTVSHDYLFTGSGGFVSSPGGVFAPLDYAVPKFDGGGVELLTSVTLTLTWFVNGGSIELTDGGTLTEATVEVAGGVLVGGSTVLEFGDSAFLSVGGDVTFEESFTAGPTSLEITDGGVLSFFSGTGDAAPQLLITTGFVDLDGPGTFEFLGGELVGILSVTYAYSTAAAVPAPAAAPLLAAGLGALALARRRRAGVAAAG
ncbi:MAG: hypothetical protein VYD87_18585 [Pseudomonadota bacterium]|nr:hypothetical protein [Pseudomonadota bacterium]